MLPINHVWAVILLVSFSISLYLLKLYLKGKDKRKLMFSIGFLFSNVFFIGAYLGYVGPGVENPSVLWHNAFVLSSIPLMFAVFFAVNEYFIKIKFDFLFYIFIISIFFSTTLIFLPIKIMIGPNLIRQIFGAEVFIASFYQYYKTKDVRNLYFFFFIFTSIIGGISFNYDTLMTSFSFIIGYIFLLLTFIKPKYQSKIDKKTGIGDYFSLQEKIKTAENKFKKLFNTVPDAIALLSQDGTILEINNSMAENFKTSKENIIGKNMHSLLPQNTDKERTKIAMQAFKTGESKENFDKRKNKYFHNFFVPIKVDQEQKNLMIIARDITDQKIAEKQLETKIDNLKDNEKATLNIMEDFQNTIEQLEKAQKEIKFLNKNLEKKVDERTKEIQKLLKQKEEFIWQLGHDLKTPLTPITTLLPILKEKLNDKKNLELLEVSIDNAEYMKNLVTKTLELAKINSPNAKPVFENFYLYEEFNKIIKNRKYLIDEMKASVENRIDTEIVVKADKIMLQELFENLISNSLKYTNDKPEIIINAQQKDDQVLVSFKDNGMGMDKKQLEDIFGEFYKVDDSRHDLSSSGLGLTICKRIVEKHGGRIWAESDGKGKGSTFYFTLKTIN